MRGKKINFKYVPKFIFDKDSIPFVALSTNNNTPYFVLGIINPLSFVLYNINFSGNLLSVKLIKSFKILSVSTIIFNHLSFL